MAAQTVLIRITRGEKFTDDFTWYNPLPNTDPPQPDLAHPIDLTGYHARMTIRDRGNTNAILHDMDDAGLGGIVLGGVAGTIHREISAIVTETFDWAKGEYDLKLIPPSGEADAFFLLEGTVIVAPRSTV